ncbi:MULTISPECIES: hypothetical protein [Shewanella]|jgi:hypothetical protein|uniref:Uncharacterized protein n=3 Tax=Shewanella putrefaciens TaxID=24 RepID=E6XI50_SHEP2|nr:MULTISPECIES: hypothetical protein [Shewanella]CAD6365392.1 hypothetical protein SHEWT2_00568 [Shewanella hafniensis]ABM25173.1 conserved hypothetical protein [Shewanella sp. W3-18-1]AVV82660.1 hypothetical protein SPWS13_0849 [Shewanella putrefaciens]MCA1895856.1 hypothetical protein [Shewanella putrefaciens]MCT8942014.1 hypothetical protein [Shewanella putrefaciens]
MNKFTLMVIGGIALSFITSINAFAKNEYEQDKQGKGLPPGLQKKVDRGEPLPPGWQKKLRRGDILELDIYNRGRIVVPLDKDGIVSIQIEGALIKLDDKTRTILDIVNVITY